ncbi:hypothetical protein B0J13DRAFT_242408 [Dactylonectria estremocensis]|uniref:Zn(2)-C6 fungal-type domain-containing protein n=1 Tax=Dactylonectria estremocensis TaxID=1079267 RepID=A0A9P9D798_9HYPO|nr:hypothetical protein B0J13DRAFT_242408 [Dactylonectria estremocensis]
MTRSPLSPQSPGFGAVCTATSPEPSPQTDAGVLSSDPADDSNTTAATIIKVQRRPVPRKGHSKSRRGCFNCKRRRVKCSEELPRCQHCARSDVDCEYPVIPRRQLPSPEAALRTTPTVLGLEDLRFFHHFLVRAYPPMPFGSKPIWDSLAAMVHEYDFLAHAFLGLAAQHLTLTTAADYSSKSLNHRIAAMKSLSEALSQPCLIAADRDSRYGAILALTFQASAMPDALMEFLVTMRGCLIIGESVTKKGDSSFAQYGAEAWIECFQRMIPPGSTPRYDEAVLNDVSMSLRVVAPLCQRLGELKYLAQLERIVQLARTDVTEAFLSLAMSFSITNKLTDDEFAAFTAPNNHVAQILLAHFLILDHIIETWVCGSKCLPYPFKRDISLRWVDNVAAKLPTGYKKSMMWPLGTAVALREVKA